MTSRRLIQRSATTVFVVASLLFAQLALARYVCPAAVDAATMVVMTESGQPCEGMDEAAPALCHQHAVDAAQSFELTQLTAPTLPSLVWVVVLPVLLDSARGYSLTISSWPDRWPPPEPVFFATLRLRV